MSEKSWTALAFEQDSGGMNVVSKVVFGPHDTGKAFPAIAGSLPKSWFLVAIVPGAHEVTCPNIIKVALSEDRTDLMFGYDDNKKERVKNDED